ncbi:sugar O-acetyltransferase [Cellulomonas alba]|uniref:Sugar O-acetyltransferase n=1 Tax=Cellulomonas alba TaxID=3053467 RepID=A0ABT7SF12_9CELL|nr:sugar O-acetyltransferase [Cellulomonas alba]MDM7854757.1 sugar O-acetyltransferase [Cellulomonas alba]
MTRLPGDDPTDTRTEYQKMVAGDWYRYRLSAELGEITARNHEASRRLTEVYRADPQTALVMFRDLLGFVGEGVDFRPPFSVEYGHHVSIGRGTFVNADFLALGGGRITIGEDVLIGPGVRFYTPNHPLDPDHRRAGYERVLPIVVGDNVWIGGSAILLPGVTVGADAIVGAGAVVTRDVPPATVVAGNPARVIRRLREDAAS